MKCCSRPDLKEPIDCTKNKNGHLQLKLNMFVASLFQLKVSITYTMVFSSIYLFVTSPAHVGHGEIDSSLNSSDTLGISDSPDEQHSWSGLGESDFYYSWISTARGFGLLVGSLVGGWFPFLFSFRTSMLITFFFALTGSLFYANATMGWMVLIAQFLAEGIAMGLLLVLSISYISATCKVIEERESIGKRDLNEAANDSVKSKRRNSKYTLKDKYLTLNLLLRNIGWPLGVGISSVMAQFEETIDQYRWPGWASLSVQIFFSILFLLVYRKVNLELNKTLKYGKLCGMGKSTTCKTTCNMKRFSCKTAVVSSIVYTYLAYTAFLTYSLTTAVNTLLSPALSDHFGFSIVYISYFTLGIMLIAFGASLVLVSLKSLKVNNRIVLIVSLLMSLTGTMLATDWQAIGQDPCHLQFVHALTSNASSYHNDTRHPFMNGSDLEIANLSDVNIHEESLTVMNNSDLADICIEGSSDRQECYWNPNSRITGTLCSLCRPVCRTESMSINFVQFSLGIGLISVSALLMWAALLGVATDCTAKDAQSTVVGMLYTSSGLSWMITPLWCIWIYDAVGKRLFGPMFVWSLLVILSLVGCIVLYKQIGPIKPLNKIKKDETVKVKEPVMLISMEKTAEIVKEKVLEA